MLLQGATGFDNYYLILFLLAGIYIHIPFCRQACHYCNFHFSVSQKNRKEFVRALVKEIYLQRDFFESPGMKTDPLASVYFGGGTPSLLADEELKEIFDTIHTNFSVSKDAEVTLEANPDDLNPGKLALLRSLGVNRLSIGIQSFHEADLQYMNRSHTAQQAFTVLKDAIENGFKNITADLIYGTPGMSDEMWRENIMHLINLNIPHISAYSLTVEKKTALDVFIRKGIAAPVDEEQSARQFEILCEVTAMYGYEHYEISNFGKKGFYSRHNLAYWSGEPYLGLGPSAHSYQPGFRQWNIANTGVYIRKINDGIIPLEREELTADQQYNEYIMTGLRTMWGVDKNKVKDLFGESYYQHMMHNAGKHIALKLMDDCDDHLVITPAGRFLSDGIASDLFRD